VVSTNEEVAIAGRLWEYIAPIGAMDVLRGSIEVSTSGSTPPKNTDTSEAQGVFQEVA